MKRGGDKPVCFFFVRFCYVSCGYALSAMWAKQRSVKKGKVNCPLNYPFVIHLYQIALAGFLIPCNETFTMGAAYFQIMAALYFSAIWVFVDFHAPVRCTIPSVSLYHTAGSNMF